MGISKFNELIPVSKRAALRDIIRQTNNKYIIVDASCYICGKCSSLYKKRACISTTSTDRDVTHVFVVLDLAQRIMMQGITPVFVFDGRSIKEKDHTIRSRARHGCETEIKIDDSGGGSRCSYYERAHRHKEPSAIGSKATPSFKMNHSRMIDCVTVLGIIGVPYVIALEEADQQCAALSCHLRAGVISRDTDIIVFGGTAIYDDFPLHDRSVHVTTRRDAMMYVLDRVNYTRRRLQLASFDELTHDNFVSLAIMMGTDYRGANNTTVDARVTFDVLLEHMATHDFDPTGIIPNEDMLNAFNQIRSIYLESDIIAPHTLEVTLDNMNTVSLREFFSTVQGIDADRQMAALSSAHARVAQRLVSAA